jgi:hypothetical protein
VIAAIGTGVYRLTVTRQGFKVHVVENIKIDAGVPATANTRLDLGQVTETVEVSTATDVVQSTSARSVRR